MRLNSTIKLREKSGMFVGNELNIKRENSTMMIIEMFYIIIYIVIM